MPTTVERRLKREAKRKFPGDQKRQDAYVYGALRRLGWKPKREQSS